MIEWLKKRRKQKMRDRIVEYLCEMRKIENQGLLLKQLIRIPEVRTYRLVTGMYSYCDVTMDDGYTLTGNGTWDEEIIKDAMYKVVQRLKERYEL